MGSKYEYLLHCWGGFWNDHNIVIHKEPEIPYKWFNTKEERDLEIKRLKNLEINQSKYLKDNNKINDSCIVMSLSEGYLTRYKFIIKSLIQLEDKIIEIENNLGYGFYSIEEFDELGQISDYMKEWKYDICTDLPDNHKRLYTTLILEK